MGGIFYVYLLKNLISTAHKNTINMKQGAEHLNRLTDTKPVQQQDHATGNMLC